MIPLLRIAFTASALSLCLVVAGCENFDPTSVFDAEIFNTKKKLPGDRRPVFPEGTPGVPQGVPEELVKGYQPSPEQEPPVQQAQPVEQKAKPKPKPKVVAKPKEQPAPAPAATSVTVRPPSAQSQPAQQSPWPDPPPTQPQQPAAAWPGSQQPGVAWPDPPPTR